MIVEKIAGRWTINGKTYKELSFEEREAFHDFFEHCREIIKSNNPTKK